ncbi:MAG: hypothetical protein OXU61_10180, partial [Gammaproteobacteria bacterium]|nr:hypothetical protein [Gammaproteobacteria bacterium]
MATVNEGQSADFTVTLAGAGAGSAANIDVPYTVTSSGTYNVVSGDRSGTVSIAAGMTTGTITLSLPVDAALGDSDPDQTLTVALGATPTVAAGGGAVARSAAVSEQSASVVVNFVSAMHIFSLDRPATSIDETDADANISYTLTRTGPVIADATNLTIQWAVAAGTAGAADFSGGLLSTSNVTFTGTGSSESFLIGIAGDDLNEAGETFTISFSTSGVPGFVTTNGGVSLPADLTVTINDDDPVTVAIARASGTSPVAESGGALDFTVTLGGGTRASGVGTVVPFTVGGAGVTADDFDITAPGSILASATGGAITIAQGSSTGTVTLTLTDDSLNEGTESLTVTGTAVGATGLRLTGSGAGGVEYTTGGDTVSVDVTDNDPITVSIANGGTDADLVTGGFQVEEGGSAIFTVTLSAASVSEVQVPFAITGLEAADTTVTPPASPLTIAAGQSSGAIVIALARDADSGADDTSEDVTVELGATAADYMAAGTIMRSATASEQSATQSIVPSSTARTLTVTGPSALTETDGDLESGDYTVALSGMAFTVATDVTWTVTHGSTEDADFVAASDRSGTVSFGTGDGDGATMTFTLTVDGDDLNEAAETFTVQVSVADASAAGGTAYGAAASTTIADDDPISVSIANGGTDADDRDAGFQVEEGSSATFTVTLSAASASEVQVPFTIGGELEAADTTGTDPTSPLRIAAGDTAGDLVFALAEDADTDRSERLVVLLDATGYVAAGTIARSTTVSDQQSMQHVIPAIPPPVAYTYTLTATGDNGDRDPTTPELEVDEGDAVTITLALSGISASSIIVVGPETLFGGSATQGQDYTGPSVGGVVLWPLVGIEPTDDPLAQSRTYSITDDNAAEPDETITLAVPALTVDFGRDTYTTASTDIAITIRASDRPLLAVAVDDANIAEGETAVFTVTLSDTAPTSGSTITVDWAVSGTGITTTDYTVSGSDTDGTLGFTGLGSQTLTFAIANDADREDAETLTFTLSNASAGSAIVAPVATTTIAASDQPVAARNITLSAPATVAEGATISFDVSIGATET